MSMLLIVLDRAAAGVRQGGRGQIHLLQYHQGVRCLHPPGEAQVLPPGLPNGLDHQASEIIGPQHCGDEDKLHTV